MVIRVKRKTINRHRKSDKVNINYHVIDHIISHIITQLFQFIIHNSPLPWGGAGSGLVRGGSVNQCVIYFNILAVKGPGVSG